MLRKRRFRSTLEHKADINITPLMDVMCLLLVVFIITMPALEMDMDVSPPKYKPKNQIDDRNSVLVTIYKGAKRIRCDRQDIKSDEQLDRLLKAKLNENHEAQVVIRADETVELGEVFRVMRLAQKAGYSRIGMATQDNETK